MLHPNYRLLNTEERANVISHLLGLLVFALVSPLLLLRVGLVKPTFLVFGLCIFCVSGCITLLISSLYHLQVELEKKNRYRKLDHIAIYLLIGGSYTAFIALYYNEYNGWVFLIVHWSLIFVGIIFKFFFTGKLEILSTLFYLLLGWMVVIVYSPIA